MTTVVEMVGAGPGDPDLLTLRAEAALAAATVVVADPAVAHLAAAFAPAATVSICAAGGGAAVDGDAIRILTGSARRDERVVRLYRGDPWLHPAYAVESGILAGAGIAHVAVPGPSVELAAPGAAGLAVHHGPLAVTVTTAAPAALPAATDPARTLVTVTDDATSVAAGLLRDGDPDMPVAVVRLGEGVTVAHRGTLASLAAMRSDAHTAGPLEGRVAGQADAAVDGRAAPDAVGQAGGDGDDPTLGPGVVVVGAIAAP